MSQKALATTIMAETTRKAKFMFVWPAIQPMRGGEMASPKMWMARMFKAKAVARVPGGVTLARAALAGPVLKKRKKTARKTKIQAPGKGVWSMSTVAGKARRMANPETRK